jgi:hypothetical protein
MAVLHRDKTAAALPALPADFINPAFYVFRQSPLTH